jgi:hypothetical protein
VQGSATATTVSLLRTLHQVHRQHGSVSQAPAVGSHRVVAAARVIFFLSMAAAAVCYSAEDRERLVT